VRRQLMFKLVVHRSPRQPTWQDIRRTNVVVDVAELRTIMSGLKQKTPPARDRRGTKPLTRLSMSVPVLVPAKAEMNAQKWRGAVGRAVDHDGSRSVDNRRG
jgi:hypothetical protein